MFTNKHDPLVDSVKSVMEKNNLRRQVEEALNEELGVSSRKAVPHEHLASYDAMLEEAYKCAMKEADEKDYSGDYHVLTPDGKTTVLVSNMEKDANEVAQRFGKGYKVYRGDKLPDTWEGAGVGGSMFAGKKETVKEAKTISHPNQEIISKQDGNPASISRKDLAILRKKKKAGEEIKQEETQLDEKAVSKAQHRFFGLVRGIQKGQAHGSAKAEKAAKEMSAKEVRKFAKTKEKGLPERVDESLESIMEEIRANLEEKLVSVYESGDAQMFEEFVSSLTEEQLELLGLSEMGLGTSVFGDLGAQAAANLANRPARAARPAPTSRPSAAPAAGRPAPAQAARPAPATGTSTTARPAPAAKPETSNVPAESGYGRTNLPINQPKPAPGTPPKYVSPEERGQPSKTEPNIDRTLSPQPALKPGQAGEMPSQFDVNTNPLQGRKYREPPPSASTSAKPTAPLSKPGEFRPSVKPLEKQTPDELDKTQKAAFGESYHIKESLESMIRSKYLKG